MKSNILALVVIPSKAGSQSPAIIETLSDEKEIHWFEQALQTGEADPLGKIHEQRALAAKEEEEFGDYVEQLVSQPFIQSEIRDHGIQWLRSKIRIEQYQKTEAEAAKIISEYAFKIYLENRRQTDFFLAGPTAQVRIRIFELPAQDLHGKAS